MAPWLEISELDLITFIKDYRNSSDVKIKMKQAGNTSGALVHRNYTLLFSVNSILIVYYSFLIKWSM